MSHQEFEENQYAERYLRGGLSDEESARFEEHYLDCPECLDQLELAGRLGRGMKGVAAEAMTRMGLLAWLARASRSRGLALAALGLVVLALVPAGLLYLRAGRLGAELDRALAPQANTLILQLSPERALPDAGAPAARLTLGPEPEWIVLALEIDGPEHRGYRVSLRRADGELVWRGDGLEPDSLGVLNLSLHSSLLEPGDYRLEVEGLAATGPVPVARFAFRVAP